jgi:hypothetical protein
MLIQNLHGTKNSLAQAKMCFSDHTVLPETAARTENLNLRFLTSDSNASDAHGWVESMTFSHGIKNKLMNFHLSVTGMQL